jgi:hypothetical protein
MKFICKFKCSVLCTIWSDRQTDRQAKWSFQPSKSFRPAANIYHLFAAPKYVRERLSLHSRFQSGGRVEDFMKSGYCWVLRLPDMALIQPEGSLQFIKKDPTRCNNVSNFTIPYLYEAQHVSGDTPPIIRCLKLHWQPLVFHTWKVVCTCSWWTLSGTLKFYYSIFN